MANRQLKLYAKPQAGNTTTTTISNVNPQATSATMKSFAQMLNAFTNNTYEKTDLVETTNVDTETVTINRTITLDQTTAQIINGKATFHYSINPAYRSTNVVEVFKSGSPLVEYPAEANLTQQTITITTNDPGEYVIRFALLATENYNAASTTQTVTVTAS